MKQKKVDNKLVLNKETIASLDEKMLNDMRGGTGTLTQYCTSPCDSAMDCGRETYDTLICCTNP